MALGPRRVAWSSNASRSTALAAAQAFPRGGADTLTPLEKREIEQQAKEELDAELASGKAPKRIKVC